jgi:hypothetical protein
MNTLGLVVSVAVQIYGDDPSPGCTKYWKVVACLTVDKCWLFSKNPKARNQDGSRRGLHSFRHARARQADCYVVAGGQVNTPHDDVADTVLPSVSSEHTAPVRNGGLVWPTCRCVAHPSLTGGAASADPDNSRGARAADACLAGVWAKGACVAVIAGCPVRFANRAAFACSQQW